LILAVALIGPLTLFAWRSSAMRSEGVFQPISRESALILNNLLLVVACAVVFTGTLAPLVREFIDGSKISVGAPFFDLTFTPFMVLLIVVLPIGAMLPWKRGDAAKVMSRLWWVAGAALALGGIAYGLQSGTALLAPVGIALAAWLILGSIVDLAERGGWGRAPLSRIPGRLLRLPGGDWGKFLGHAGLGLSALGIATVTAWEIEDIRLAQPGDVIPLGAYEVHFDSVEQLPLGADFAAVNCGRTMESVVKGGEARNFETIFGRFRVVKDGNVVAHLCPEKRHYPVQATPTTEAAIDSNLLRDVYLVLGDQNTNGAWAVRSYLKPMAVWIWLGALVMGAGGLVSLTDRRFRVGAAARRAVAVPAE